VREKGQLPGLESAAIKIATAVANTAIKALVAGRRSRAERTMSLSQLALARGLGIIPQRRLERQLGQLAESIADRILPTLESDSRRIRENEQLAALDAVVQTLESVNFSDDVLLSADVDESTLLREISPTAESIKSERLLSDAGIHSFDLVLRESVSHLTEVIVTLPSFQGRAIKELLSRDTEIIDLLRDVLARMPKRSGNLSRSPDDEFRLDYMRESARRYDQVEIFGVTHAGPSRQYSLNVAYIGLSLTTSQPAQSTERASGTGAVVLDENVKAETAIRQHRLLYIRGEAGSGKTTLLRWLALKSAQQSHVEPLEIWNKITPFVIQLRRFAGRDLPSPNEFLSGLPIHLKDRVPAGWVDRILTSGSGAVLLDGVDEFPEGRRHQLLEWISDLESAYPRTRIIVTSRPSATPSDWLESLNFVSADLTPMTRTHIASFVKHWHDAMVISASARVTSELAEDYRRSLLASLEQSRPLRMLASNPLLCALLCALHWERKKKLPKGRIGIYRTALDMLLKQRDHERLISDTLGVDLAYEDSLALLEGLAYWFTLTEQSDAGRDRVEAKIRSFLEHMPHVKASEREVLQFLIVRSGLLREPAPGRVDFIHKTFQEYLAASRFLEEDAIEVLLRNAWRDSYHEVIVMTAGIARPREASELISSLLDLAERPRVPAERRARLRLLAVSCLEVTVRRPPELDRRVRLNLQKLVPPTTTVQARVLASLGEQVLDVLPVDTGEIPESHAAATVRCAALVGGRQAINLLKHAAADRRAAVQRELCSAWSYFDPIEFANEVLNSRRGDWRLTISDPYVLPGLDYVERYRSVLCSFTGQTDASALNTLDNVRNLRSLHISENSFISELRLSAHKASLRELRVVDCVTLRQLTGLKSLGNLARLDISGCPVSISEADLEGLANLRQLQFHGSKTIPMDWALYRWPKLTKLELGAPIGVANISSIGDSESLTSLSLKGCPGLESLQGLSQFPNLKALAIEDCGDLSSLAGIVECGENLSTLRIVDIHHLPSIKFVEGLEQLEVLVIERCTLADLAPLLRVSNVKRVVVSDCDIEDESALGELRERFSHRLSYSSFTPDPSRLESAMLDLERGAPDANVSELEEIEDLLNELKRSGEWVDDASDD
jgi:Leucine-rich repeat (LRR) protein